MSNSTESNRLPLRAGAMLLLAVAVVFAGLGLHSATKSPDPEQAAVQSAASDSTATTTEPHAAPPAGSAASSAPESSESSEASTTPQLCILNAGMVRGLGASVKTELEGKGWNVSGVENFQSPSITENTIFYESGQKDAADKLVGDLGSMSASPAARPSAFTRCSGQLALIVVTK